MFYPRSENRGLGPPSTSHWPLSFPKASVPRFAHLQGVCVKDSSGRTGLQTPNVGHAWEHCRCDLRSRRRSAPAFPPPQGH